MKANTSFVFTDSKIKSLKPAEKQYHVWHNDGLKGRGSLGLRVNLSGQKVFVYRYYLNGKPKIISLGSYPSISLHEANQLKNEAARIYIDEIKPESSSDLNRILKKNERQQLGTVRDLFNAYLDDMRHRNRRTVDDVANYYDYLLARKKEYGLDGDMLAKDVTASHITFLLSRYIKRGAYVGANKVHSVLHAAFAFGLRHDNDPAMLGIERVKFELIGNPVSLVPKQKGASKALDRFLSWAELRDLLVDAAKSQKDLEMSYNLSRLILLCLFTGGQRPIEILRMTFDHVDFERQVFNMTPDDVKTRTHHIVYLCDTAIDVIEELREVNGGEGYLFPNTKNDDHIGTDVVSRALSRYIKRKGLKPFTMRDLRRTFKTLAGELGISPEMRDRVQSHTIQGVSYKHYDRYLYLKEKKEVMELWESKLLALLP
ncbi:tyrosine-type recombinase/integrase [Pasteurellaceae bacterium TAE3-ERU1]|nr:tyrosine-type recombinase/integrase [Pasteurellaceae bacterium TAE3-ERU1]